MEKKSEKISVTLLNIKEINRNHVYNFIYEKRSTSKQQIAQGLQMGISTVSQNLKILEEAGLIERKGSFDSTGGRKADMIQIVRDARISIGAGILKSTTFLVALDLYGAVMHARTINLPYENPAAYYRIIGESIEQFVRENGIQSDRVLGVSIATQGIISADGESVSYGKIMDNYEMRRSLFAEHIPFPCRLEHDSKAAAYLELWKNPGIVNAIVLLLNRNFGGSLIINRHIIQGAHMHAGAVEHLCISKDGPLCYCGSRGCLETYCAASVIEQAASGDLQAFFESVRKKDNNNARIWMDYLDKLAFAIRNLSIVIDGHIVISGYLAPYLDESDITYLLQEANKPPFAIERKQITVGTYGQFTPAAGAALHDLDAFLKSV